MSFKFDLRNVLFWRWMKQLIDFVKSAWEPNSSQELFIPWEISFLSTLSTLVCKIISSDSCSDVRRTKHASLVLVWTCLNELKGFDLSMSFRFCYLHREVLGHNFSWKLWWDRFFPYHLRFPYTVIFFRYRTSSGHAVRPVLIPGLDFGGIEAQLSSNLKLLPHFQSNTMAKMASKLKHFNFHDQDFGYS